MTEFSRKPSIFNVPNIFTTARLILAIATFALIDGAFYSPALVVFVIAASTDWIDGYWARKYDQVTQVGRIFDPFVDKVIICGAFIFLAAVPDSGVRAWMATLVVGREILVTALRSFIENAGGDFSANMAGKLKMVFQCVAVGASLFALWWPTNPARGQVPPWLDWTLFVSVWVAVLSTVQSGLGYVVAAIRFMQE